MAFDYAPPKYAQVVSAIKQRVERASTRRALCLPSEHQLVAEFEVSRPTIVKALSALRQDGWIDTQQGKAVSCAGRPRSRRCRADPARSRGAGTRRDRSAGELVQAGVKLAPPHVAALLGLKAGAGRSCGSGC